MSIEPLRRFADRGLDFFFTRVFDTLVYNHVWEDPRVDLDALAVQSGQRIVTIGSAGCNALAYLRDDPARIDAVDLNRAQRALFVLKLEALRQLPDQEAFFRFFGEGESVENTKAYDQLISPSLDHFTRNFWEHRGITGRRRIEMFARGFYRHGLLARFIGGVHWIASLSGHDLGRLPGARDRAEQELLFDSEVAPLFDARLTRWLARSPISLYALGIPRAQYRRMKAEAGTDMVGLLRERIRRMACDFPIEDNYFAWQVFARRYDTIARRAVPMYLEPRVYREIRPRADRVHVHPGTITHYLTGLPDRSVHRFVLLDAQDWMTPADIATLWAEIGRTAVPGEARVIFRTAGTDDPFRALPEKLRMPWDYREEESRKLHSRDRSSIYSGFHLLVARPATECVNRPDSRTSVRGGLEDTQ
ncbi:MULTISPECIES: DUF3419 family protein [unclassified Mesorhizobium]|uniref:DUF3419 family protein n=1 Tax=unclassified Mesorhizobium TaxID=325217 RepID=UPI00333DF8FB